MADCTPGDVECFLQAAYAGSHEIVASQLARGVHPSARGESGHLALGLAVGQGHADIARLLLAAGADVSARPHGDTPLFAAVAGGHLTCAIILLEHGANVDEGRAATEADDGHSPLQLASALGHVGCVELLLKRGASHSVSDSQGATALHSASWQAGPAHSRIVRLLLQGGSAVDATDANGATALHLAAKYGHYTSCCHLLEWGAPLSIEDNMGASPLVTALERGHRDVAQKIATALLGGGVEGLAQLEALDGIARAELDAALTCEPGATSSDLSGGAADLPPEYASMAAALPLHIRRLLVEGAHPSLCSVSSLIRALCLPPVELRAVVAGFSLSRRALLMERPGLLNAEACAALRAAVDSRRANKLVARSVRPDSVDGLAEHQLDREIPLPAHTVLAARVINHTDCSPCLACHRIHGIFRSGFWQSL